MLASWAPALHEALTGLDESDHVIVDGTLLPTDRVRADQPYYSQKHKKHGMNVQVIARPDGTPLWFSRATPGRTHDLTSARAHGIVQACPTRQILVLADHAYQGAGARLPHPVPPPQRTARALPAVQPRPRSTPSPRRTCLRPTQVLAHHAQSTLLHTPCQPHRPSQPRTTDLRLFRTKEVHCRPRDLCGLRGRRRSRGVQGKTRSRAQDSCQLSKQAATRLWCCSHMRRL